MKCFNYFKYLLLALAAICSPIQANKCPPEPISCVDILHELDIIEKQFDQCCFDINSCLDTVLAEVNALPGPCDQRIFIDQDFMNSATPQITQSNTTYCLIESVTGSLVVDADNVTIEMNGHSMKGASNVIEVTGHSNFALLGNGVIKGGSPNGVLIKTCTNVKIENISFEQNETGATFDMVTGFRIDKCSFTQNGGVGVLDLINSRNGKVTCCLMHDNNNNTICFIASSANIEFFEVSMDNNQSNNVSLLIQRSQNCIFQNCSTNSNALIGTVVLFSQDCFFKNFHSNANINNGFRIRNCNKIILDRCEASNNSNGISIQDCTNSCLLNSIAKENTVHGIEISGLFDQADNYAFNNIAIANGEGIRDFGVTRSIFLSNYAEGNTTNYVDVVSPITRFDTTVGEFRDPVNSCTPVSPSDWDNIAVEACP